MKESQPTAQQWKALYDAAVEFRKLGCWEWMYDSDIFGVLDLESGEIGYCCVLGNLGEVFALAVYLGTAGLEGYLMLQSGELTADTPDVLHYQKCLMASFEDRSDLDKADLNFIKQAGLKFRGQKSWPQFRSYQPGYLPWHLTADEARFLTVALQQAIDVALRVKEDNDLLEASEDDLYLVRVPEKSDSRTVWADRRLMPAPLEEKDIVVEPVDEIRLKNIKKRSAIYPGAWEVDFFYAPSAVKDKGRPYFPHLLVCVDHQSYFILNFHIARPDNYLSEFQDKVLEIMEASGAVPNEILVQKDELFDLLDPIASKLGIKLVLIDDLEAVENVRSGMFSFFGLGPG